MLHTHTHTHTRMHVKIKDGCLEKDGPALRLADSTRRYPQASAVKGDRVRRDQRGSTPLPPKKKRHSFFFYCCFSAMKSKQLDPEKKKIRKAQPLKAKRARKKKNCPLIK